MERQCPQRGPPMTAFTALRLPDTRPRLSHPGYARRISPPPSPASTPYRQDRQPFRMLRSLPGSLLVARLTPSPSSAATGGPKVRQVIGRHSYKSHNPVAGSSTGHTSSFAKSAKSRSASSPTSSTPVLGFPGKSAESRATDSRDRATIRFARARSDLCNTDSPSHNRAASSWLIANTPTQHCVHPGLHASHSPERCAVSVSAASIIWTSFWSPAGRRAAISRAYRKCCALHIRRTSILILTPVFPLFRSTEPLPANPKRSPSAPPPPGPQDALPPAFIGEGIENSKLGRP